MTYTAEMFRDRNVLKHLLLALIVAITFFVNNRVLEPDIMESRNLITAREMVEKGNWLIPTMNDELRLEKPPLPTWISAVIESVSPDDIAMQRFAAGLVGILLVVYFYRFGRRILKTDGVLSTILLCTCYNFLLMARTVSWDIYCHAFMMAGIYYFASAVTREGRQWRSFVAAGVMTGLSIMSKGPVSLFALFLPFLLSFCIFARPGFKGKWGGVAAMAAIALVVGGWWYVYVHVFAGDQLQSVIAKESGSWMNRNVRPWYYYHLFFAETGVWSLLLLTSIVTIAVRVARGAGRRTLTALMWMVFCLVLLSCMPEKKTRYLLPMLIPAAYVMGQTVEWWISRFKSGESSRCDRVAFRVNCYLLATVVTALPVAGYFTVVKQGYLSTGLWLAFTAVAVAAGVALFVSAARLKPARMVWSIGLLFAAAMALVMPSIGKLVNNPEMTGLDLTVGMSELEGLPFYHPDDEELRIELVYAARRDIRKIDLNDTAAVRRAMPMALLTHAGASKEFPEEFFATTDTVHVGVFDCNRRPKGTRRYSQSFIYHITILKNHESNR